MSEIRLEKRDYPQGDDLDWHKIHTHVELICETFNLKELLCLGSILQGVYAVRMADNESGDS